MCKVTGENKQTHYIIYIYILNIYIYIYTYTCQYACFSKLFSSSSHEFTSCFFICWFNNNIFKFILVVLINLSIYLFLTFFFVISSFI